MRRALDGLYTVCGVLAGLAMVLLVVMVMIEVIGARIGVFVPWANPFAGYMMAAVIFLALAHTFRRGEHIRVTLILERLSPLRQHHLDLVAFAFGVALSGLFAAAAIRLVYISWLIHDVSPAMDATPMWIPQLTFAFGASVFFIAMVDDFVAEIRGRREKPKSGDEPLHIE